MSNIGSALNANWLYDSPVNSDVEAKLRRFLVELGNADKILGIQVCAYKDGEVIIDTAAGVLGKDDPRPVQPDSLFSCFSVTKGVTAGMIHWLADKGKLKLDENVANFWPEFGTNGKDQIQVNHILNHTAGLHNALAGISEEDDPKLFCDFEQCLKHIVEAAPETQPGQVELYHYLSYGWLCGGIIQKASGKKFQEILEEAFVRPLNVEGEFYIGIPPGVESRLATLTIDTNVISWYAEQVKTITYLPSTYTFNMISTIVAISNTLNVRRAIVPAANGHFSARALARYYATLVDGGIVPPRHSSSLDSQLNNPTFPSNKTDTKIFINSKENIHNAFFGHGAYKDLSFPNGKFGLGFQKFKIADGSVIGFGHPGLGGSTGYCDINTRFAIGVTFNKLHSGAVTEEIVRFVCSNLDIPVPQDQHKRSTGFTHKPVIN
uniref:beta-lactamase domain-containing protein 2-like n=1 Tax=Erigeron canadensis TaxID=72917 RepID=UPI001CB987D9|nr:beta-lactamase domain-containing protein 2-like [Erigeron canadensis]